MFSFFKSFLAKDEKVILGSGEDALEVFIKRRSNSKTIRIRITLKNKVEVTLPKYAPIAIAHKFLLDKEEWIRSRLQRVEESSLQKRTISILGKEYELVLNDQTTNVPLKFDNDKILVSHVIKNSKLLAILELHLKKIAKKEIEEHCNKICGLLNIKYNRISIRDTVTRWGSCSSDKNLSFSWRLVLAPRSVMEYVVVHEVCHLIEMNHSPKFWKLVYQTCPEYFEAKIWLKKNGKRLHNLI